MRLTAFDLVIMMAYFAGLVVFGIFVRRIRSFEDYSVAERAIPTSMLVASLCATYIGPGYSLGLAAKGASSGFLFLLPFSFFSLQTVLVGLFIAPRLRQFTECHSVGDVMGRLYGREVRIITGLISVGLCAGFASVLARAGGTVLSEATGIGLMPAVIIVTGVGVIYTLTGGLKSVIATEAIQFGIILVAVGAMVLLTDRMQPDYGALQATAIDLTRKGWHSTPSLTVVGLMVSFFLGETLIPPYANRALAANSSATSRHGFVLAGLFSLIWFALMIIVGLLGHVLVPDLRDTEGVMVALAAHVMPSGFLGLLLVAIAAIVMSTQESLLNAGAVAITRDLMPFAHRGREAGQLLTARIATAILAFASVGLALRAPSIISGLLVCYSIWAPTIVPTLIWGLLGLPTSRTAGLLSITFGGTASVACLVSGPQGGDPAIAILFGLGGSLLGAVTSRILVVPKEAKA